MNLDGHKGTFRKVMCVLIHITAKKITSISLMLVKLRKSTKGDESLGGSTTSAWMATHAALGFLN